MYAYAPETAIRYNPRVPTVLMAGPYRFYFYSHEPNEPPHVHVDRDNLSAKFWLNPSRSHEISDLAQSNYIR